MSDESVGDQDHPLQFFRRIAARRPDATAVHYPEAGGAALTYRELDTASDVASAKLSALDVGRGDRVALVLEPSVDLVVLVLAVAKLGATYLVIDPQWPSARRSQILQDAGPRATIVADSVAVTSREQHRARDLLGLPTDVEAPDQSATLSGEDPLYVCYTSGSTGTPKGVVIKAASVVNLVTNTPAIKIHDGDRVAQLSSPAFDAFTYELWGTLTTGAQLVGFPKRISTDPAQLRAAVSAHGLTVMFQTTSLFNMMTDTAPEVLARFRLILFGGERANLDSVRSAFRYAPTALVHCYGPTELTTFALIHPVVEDDVTSATSDLPIGRPIEGCIVALGEPASKGDSVHELLLGGRGLAAGYLNRPDLTAQRFIPGPPALYRTGDLVRRDSRGDFVFVGRTDHQVKLRGHRIELEEIETVLLEHPRVKQAAVVPCRQDGVVNHLVAHLAYVSDRVETDILASWEDFYDALYDGVRLEESDTAFAGWNSRKDHQPIPLDEMREWQQATVSRIRRLHPQRVLEIGVGTGLLLTKIVHECSEYWGTDISGEVIDRLRSLTASHTVRPILRRQSADDFTGLPTAHFDVVILNSVVQYFPSIVYMTDTLRGIAHLLAPGGTVFLGDLRNLGLADHYARRVGAALDDEDELLIHPDYFRELPEQVPEFDRVDVTLKRSTSHNELSVYRYDVTLRAAQGSVAERADPENVRVWDEHSQQEIETELREHPSESFRWLSIPSARLRQKGLALDPEDLSALGDRLGRDTQVDYAEDLTHVDVVYSPVGAANLVGLSRRLPASIGWPHAFANVPSPGRRRSLDVRDLRQYLRERLPEYMLPSEIIMTDELPLNTAGKVDRAALRSDTRPVPRTPREGPRTIEELWLVEVIAEALAVHPDGVSTVDDFFEMGGHSLLAAKLANRIRRLFDIELGAPDLYRAPSARALTTLLHLDEGDEAGQTPAQPAKGAPVTQDMRALAVPERRDLEVLARDTNATVSVALLAHCLLSMRAEFDSPWIRLWVRRSATLSSRSFAIAEADLDSPVTSLTEDLARQLQEPAEAADLVHEPDVVVTLLNSHRHGADELAPRARHLAIDALSTTAMTDAASHTRTEDALQKKAHR